MDLILLLHVHMFRGFIGGKGGTVGMKLIEKNVRACSVDTELVAIHALNKKNTSGSNYFIRPNPRIATNPWIFVNRTDPKCRELQQ